jgi:hypothetical protein
MAKVDIKDEFGNPDILKAVEGFRPELEKLGVPVLNVTIAKNVPDGFLDGDYRVSLSTPQWPPTDIAVSMIFLQTSLIEYVNGVLKAKAEAGPHRDAEVDENTSGTPRKTGPTLN